MSSREAKARISYVVDVAQCAATLAFLYAWVQSVAGSTAFFSSQFMKAGFCNAPAFPTQWACVSFDAAAATLFTGASLIWPAKLTMPVAGYLAAHGFGHYELASGLAVDHDILDGKPVELMLLAIILAIGPAEVAKTCSAVGVRKHYALAIGVACEALVVSIFVFAIRRSVFALLYINVSIMLCITLARLALLGVRTPSHVAARVDDEPLFFAKLCSLSSVVAVMVAEPTLCESGFAAAGGHVWFDVALFVDAAVSTYNVAHAPQAKLKSA